MTATLSAAASRAPERELGLYFLEAPAAICVLEGTRLTFTMANRAFVSATKPDVVGKPLLEAFPELAGQGLDQILLKVMRTGQAHSGKEMPLRLDRLENGRLAEVYWTFTASALPAASGAEPRVMLFCSDVTAQVQARERMARQKLQLEQKVERRSRELRNAARELEAFCYSVAHDLRAPLRSISNYTELLVQTSAKKLDSQARGDFHRILQNSAHMSRLIDGLLNMSRLARKALKPELVDLSAAARAVAAELRRADPGRKAEFSIQPRLTVRGDAELLRTVVQNLLENAWKFTSKHPRARIEFSSVSRVGGRAFYVRDDGAGFDQDHAEKLFGAFSRLHHASEFPGTGIGLATVQRVIDRHGGRVWATGAVEKGAAFYFTIGARRSRRKRSVR